MKCMQRTCKTAFQYLSIDLVFYTFLTFKNTYIFNTEQWGFERVVIAAREKTVVPICKEEIQNR